MAAGRLIDRFGSPSRLMAAPSAAILAALSDNLPAAQTILAARDLFDFAARSVAHGERVDPRSLQTLRFLRHLLTGREEEALHAIYLDGDGGYLGDEAIAEGGSAQVEFRFRPLIARLLEVGARGVVLAHNHPSGDERPSRADRAATAQFAQLAATLGIALADHIIIAGDRAFSIALGKTLRTMAPEIVGDTTDSYSRGGL